MPRLVHRNPKYRRHRPSGQAVVTIDGRDFYLGTYGTKASRDEYDRLIGEYLSAGRRLSHTSVSDLCVAEVIAAYWHHARRYYRNPDGTPSGELGLIRLALRPLKRLYGRTPAAAFGPLALKAIRDEMIRPRAMLDRKTGKVLRTVSWSRGYANRQTLRIRAMFRWACENEMVPASVYQGLRAVAGLRKGRTEARETEPVRPVSDADVEATLPHLSRQVGAMIALQRITAMRPAEVCGMRGCDLDTRSEPWVYRPAAHKTAHHGHAREIFLGQRCREILNPFLTPDVQAYLFSPHQAVMELRAARRAARKTPLSCGNVPGSNRSERPRRKPGDFYTVVAYRRAIARACDSAGVARWHPHQLRHTAATEFRKRFGIETAQTLLGHKRLSATQVYAEQDVAAARQVMAQVG